MSTAPIITDLQKINPSAIIELFTPGASGGQVSPMGSTNIVVNVDASGSNVQGDQHRGKELGAALSVAIQSELLKQKRPGGLLA